MTLTKRASTVETVRAAVEQHTNVWLAVGVAVGPLATAMLIGWGVVKFLLPYVREELAASRKFQSCLVASTAPFDETA